MTPRVRFTCTECAFCVYVVPSQIVLVGGIPRSTFVPFHECANGGQLQERGMFEGDFFTTMPGYQIKVKL